MAQILCFLKTKWIFRNKHNSQPIWSIKAVSYFCLLFTADSLFLATISEVTVAITPGEPIIWDTAPINPGGHFNTILGMYEAPVNGYYQYV